MAQDVNQSETDIAAQVRSALVAHIGAERFDLWIAPETRWCWSANTLTLAFTSDFSCQLVRRMLGKELAAMLNAVAGPAAELKLEVGQVDAGVRSGNSDGEIVEGSAGASPSRWSHNSEEVNASGSAGVVGSAGASPSRSQDADDEQVVSIPFARPADFTTAASSSTTQQLNAQHANAQHANVQHASVQHANVQHANVQHASAQTPNSANAVRASAVRESGTRESVASGPWDRFVSGTCNQLAWTSANMVVAEPGRMTPVLFYGPCGVGKSHLLAAIAHQLRSRCRMRRVVHMTSEQFTNDFTEAIKGSGLPMFRRKYRDVEALIIDDVHFLIGKKATLGEFKHTIDNLMRLGKQIILTADRSLNDLQSLGSDVVGRLRGALISPLMPIDETTRAALLERELVESSVQVPAEVIQQIASRTVGDGRVLQGIVKRLVAVASQARDALSWDDCWNAVYDLVQATQPVVRLGDIERVVCEVFGLEPTSLQSPSKARTVAQPRMLAMFLARKYTPAAYKEIGDYFGNRRHSTVISAEKTVEEWLRDNTELGDARGLSVRDAIRHVESHLQVG